MKHTTTKVLQDLKNYLNACGGLTDDQKQKFNQMIGAVFYAESPVIKGGKLVHMASAKSYDKFVFTFGVK